jgi:hypothetical protein
MDNYLNSEIKEKKEKKKYKPKMKDVFIIPSSMVKVVNKKEKEHKKRYKKD